MDTLRFCTAGSVDDGKSTFVGRLLHDTKSVLADQLAQVEQTSARRGFAGLDLSLLVDGLRAEREQGITIDVAYRYFSTPNRTFILADTPGHVQYTRNTVTGISTSQVVVLLVDARHGVVDQTRKHLTVAALLGIRTVILGVNKIDLVDYSEDVFRAIEGEFRAVAAELGIADPHAIPISALHGDNVVDASPRLPWYFGPTILELLETIPVDPGDSSLDFRFPIQYVIRATDYRGYAGQVATGTIAVGDTVTTPHGSTTVTAIDTTDGPATSAHAGDSVTLRLADDIDLSRGDLLATNRPPNIRSFAATIIGLDDTLVTTNTVVHLRYGTSLVKARVTDPVAVNDIVHTAVELQHDLPIDSYAARGAVGSFLLVDNHTGSTLAAGLVA
ncbi:sulfate adenylyltransferase subunit 1 [Corynebacterium matruchotii]|jgi:sulfate adenylyltransferase, large subunit|uniref:sulfate adenylyltransferase n=2 Tax=Corynebacterium matruchotii TaxID=43768 RepID=E0DEK4_9CORY|nr:GTP-binding protein [Corynebacterium matruchotii]EFM49469.1 sulfate adenylyltransferase, large subunit [Corynebacterium matruchotii ATCC 14266]KAB1925970.1 sulfate adenylyltransferase [Corynebacterium matruchotii]QIP45047.1 50S ribosome-binding GTPase [Corynebacterium matruchotii]SPW28657.1 sulfate adenylyltransferase subunit 1 / adenylylsulfate kinase [Corynebacterium matruchotii]